MMVSPSSLVTVSTVPGRFQADKRSPARRSRWACRAIPVPPSIRARWRLECTTTSRMNPTRRGPIGVSHMRSRIGKAWPLGARHQLTACHSPLKAWRTEEGPTGRHPARLVAPPAARTSLTIASRSPTGHSRTFTSLAKVRASPARKARSASWTPVSYTHLRAHETHH